MDFGCPECGTRLRAARPGAVLACGRCGNPVRVPVRAPPAAPPVGRDAPRAALGAALRPGVPWGRVLLVLGGLLVAHVGLYLLLAGGARARVAALDARHAGLEAGVPDPGPMPDPASPAYPAWDRARERMEAARERARHERHRSLLAGGLGFSWCVQAGIVLGLAWRFEARRRRRAPA